MSLNTIKAPVIICLIFVFSSCSRTVYLSNTYSYNTSNQTKVTRQKKIAPQKIRNSDAMYRATMKSYIVNGKRYYPTTASIGDKYNGIASWYGPNFHAKQTSNGEIYNMYAFTAAHKTLPMNTMVKVYNKENHKSVIVRINDRGPFVSGRIIDLSNVAARKIDMIKEGTAKVKLTILGFDGKIAKTDQQKQQQITSGEYRMQVGAFINYSGAKITMDRFNVILSKPYKAHIKKGTLNRVFILGFRSENEAIDFKKTNKLKDAMILAK